MTCGGYKLIYAVSCNARAARALLRLLFSSEGITDFASLLKVLKSCSAEIEQEYDIRRITEDEYHKKAIDSFFADDECEDEPDEGCEDEAEDEEIEPDHSNRSDHLDCYLDGICNLLLRRMGFKNISLILKPCCYNDNQVFIGYMIGQVDTVYGDEVYDFSDIYEFRSEEELRIAKLVDNFEQNKEAVNKEMDVFRQFFNNSKFTEEEAKFYKFSDNCQGCT